VAEATEPHESNRPVVVAYDPSWAERGAALVTALKTVADDLVERVEHIGSTAIPAMAAKDVLDIQLTVSDLDGAPRALDEPFATLGFERHPYVRDHVPAGMDDDPARWAKRVWARRGHPEGDANVHARLPGSPGERVALLFRDWFRAHPDAVPAYSAFKAALADAVPDIGGYSDVKDPVVDLIIAVAERWASATGWQP
jgi:GrpB-like predicted nucleotidyltransferase (UPF0157 family)